MLSGLAKFLIGVFTGVVILVAAGAAIGYFFLTKLSVPPQKPTFPEERSREQSVEQQKSASLADALNLIRENNLEVGADGSSLSWRSSPSANANQRQWLLSDRRVVVLKESDEKKWLGAR